MDNKIYNFLPKISKAIYLIIKELTGILYPFQMIWFYNNCYGFVALIMLFLSFAYLITDGNAFIFSFFKDSHHKTIEKQ